MDRTAKENWLKKALVVFGVIFFSDLPAQHRVAEPAGSGTAVKACTTSR